MEPVGIFIFGVLLLLILAAIILPKLQRNRQRQ